MAREDAIRWGIALGLTLGIWFFGWLTQRFALAWFARWSRRTATELDEMLLGAIRPHVPIWFLLAGVMVGVRHGAPPAATVALVDKFAVAALLLSVTLAAAEFLTRLVASRAQRWPDAMPATTLTQNAVRIAVIALGALIVLANLGIQIAPLLTALGVGSLAVALALQPTLSNLFAGIHISLAHKIKVGDYVELEGGQQGYVVDIGWRATEIRELPNNLIIVPNSRIAEIIVKNYALPETQQAALVQVGVGYGSDLDKVERVTIEAARDIQRTVPGADEEFEPFIRFHTFGESSINFTVILRVKEFVDRHLITHEFVKRLQRCYAESGIEIPFPQQVVHLPAGEWKRS